MTYLTLSSGNVFVALSTDGGLTWRKVAEVAPTTVTGNTHPKPKPHGQVHLAHFGDQPSIAVGPSSVWVSYTSVPSGEVQAFGAIVSGLGALAYSRSSRPSRPRTARATTATQRWARTASSSSSTRTRPAASKARASTQRSIQTGW